MDNKFNTIDPNQSKIPKFAIIQKVMSENDFFPSDEHDKAVKAFLISDNIASWINNDFAFVEKIPQLIKKIIENKSWECLYVSIGVVTPYYCCYTKGTDSENFRAFISAKRPNGLGTTIETVDCLLEAEPEVQWQFRTLIYEAPEKQRDQSGKYISLPEGSDCPLVLGERQQKNIRAANRAGEAIPEVRELLDRGLISIDVASKLGRDIKDIDNLTAEEREYIDRRDLIGVRIKQYINTNTIPEDEDKEPAYSRKLNCYVKDLLGIKDRSKPVRMDNPKIAAQKLLEFYQGEKLKELIEVLQQGLETSEQKSSEEHQEIPSEENNNEKSVIEETELLTEEISENQSSSAQLNEFSRELEELEIENQEPEVNQISDKLIELTKQKLADRLDVVTGTLQNALNPNKIDSFPEWTRKKDPEGIAWQRTRKEDDIWYFSPVNSNSLKGGENVITN